MTVAKTGNSDVCTISRAFEPGFSHIKRVTIIAVSSSLVMLSAQSPGLSRGLNPTKPEIRAFLRADRNKDGKLTRTEFRTFVRGMAATGQTTAKLIRFFSGYSFAFTTADRNRDGIVTPQEMRSADNLFRYRN